MHQRACVKWIKLYYFFQIRFYEIKEKKRKEEFGVTIAFTSFY